MPTFYGPRKSSRGKWTQEDLLKAVEAVNTNGMAVRQAARDNNIPERTLRARLEKKDFVKGSMGGQSFLGEDAERKLCAHIKKLQASGFAPTRKTVRILAYKLAKSMGLKGRFSDKKEMAGNDWLQLFLKRNQSLSVRKAEGVSIARAEGMNKKEVQQYFELLTTILTENDLLNKPLNIFNMDESGLQLNNDPGKVIAAKGSKDVHVIKAQERGETITVVACCNAEGSFLPAYCIFKGVNKQQIWEENMPPGAVIKMRRESAYINEELFIDWLENHFIPRKPAGKCLLILDGHGSHMNSYKMLETAADHNIVLLCLPSHTTHFLQPLDRSFFKPLKTYFKNACDEFVRANPQKKIERRHFGNLLASAWTRAATPETGASGFRATGIYPLKPSAIPEHAFLSCAALDEPNESDQENESDNVINPASHRASAAPGPSTSSEHATATPSSTSQHATAGPSTSSEHATAAPSSTLKHATAGPFTIISDWTPSKMLDDISPVQTVKTCNNSKRKKQSAQNLTTPTYIAEKKEKRKKKEAALEKKTKKQERKDQNSQQGHFLLKRYSLPISETAAVKRRVFQRESSSSAESDEHFSLNDSTDEEMFDEDECVGCLESYEKTKSAVDWIKCIKCNRWLHDTCTAYKNYCMICGSKICK